jgi:hypothetical protein
VLLYYREVRCHFFNKHPLALQTLSCLHAVCDGGVLCTFSLLMCARIKWLVCHNRVVLVALLLYNSARVLVC